VLLRKPGYSDCYREVAAGGEIEVKLTSLDAPRETDETNDTMALLEVVEEASGADTARWGSVVSAPDGSGILASRSLWNPELVPLGLAKENENRQGAELWWVTRDGKPTLLWRFVSGPDGEEGFWIDAAFSPNPRWVVHSAPEGNREHLELRCLATGKSKAITGDSDATFYAPAFSGDGRQIACLSEPAAHLFDRPDWVPPEGVSGADVQVMRWNGSGRRTLTRDAYDHFAPSFSPDGSRVAYITSDGKPVTVSLADGARSVALEPRPWFPDASPEWSPDGQRLAFSAVLSPSMDDGGPSICRVLWVAAGGGASGHVSGVTLAKWHSPDELEVWATGFCAQADLEYQRLLVVGLDGRAKRTLREPAELLYAPALSPDRGRVAALVWRRDGPARIVLVDVASRAFRLLDAPQPGVPLRLGWLDGERLWVSVSGGEAVAYNLDTASGDMTKLAEIPAAQDDEEPPEVYCTSDGLILRAHEAADEVLLRTGARPLDAQAPAVREEGAGQ